ncbi:MAG: phytanoyl-CoA dioxygenase family protein, partial [Hymenobacteraceae bacterium]|nr:phytanoyl-CoA dioxygenase family protein [Hymenobacteraceae bacterium]
YGAERVSELIRGYHADPRLTALAEAFHQAPTLNLFTLANRVRPEPGGLGSGGGWHRDSVHQRQLKTLLYLTDVQDGTGAYQYVAGSHRPADLLRLAHTGQVAFNQNRLAEVEINAIVAAGTGSAAYHLHTVTAPAGTLVITDTRGLHRGQPLTHGIRYALTNYFFARHHLTARSEARFRKLFVDRK